MKKYLVALLITIPFFASAQTFDQDLFYGLRQNENVKELQEFLADKGFYDVSATGNFFSLTLSSVKKFQAAHGIVPTSGYFGPKSRTKANELLAVSGITKTEIATESGTTTTPITIAHKTTDNVVASLMEQIKILQQQLVTLQQQQQSFQSVPQQIASTSQQVAQQTQILQQIQQNTTPAPIRTPTPETTPVPDMHFFDVDSSVGDCRIKQDGKLQCVAYLQVKYRTGKTTSSLDRPKNVPIRIVSFALGLDEIATTTDGNTGYIERIYATFNTTGIFQNGTYPVTFSANGASYDYNLVINLDPTKKNFCRHSETSGVLLGNGAFCESMDVAWLDMTPRVTKITDANELKLFGINGINNFGLLRLAGVATLPKDPPHPVSFIVDGKDYGVGQSRIQLSPYFIASQNVIILHYDEGQTKSGNYEITVKSLNFFGDKDREIQFSGLPITFSITVK